MRKFVVSDIHGNLNLYVSIMNYLENINKYDNVKLYLLGDLIDRGLYSGNILLDVYDRIKNNRGFEIKYLAGNHEWMMYLASLDLEYNKSFYSINSYWKDNGGDYTFSYLEDVTTFDEMMEIIGYISSLDIYEKLDEKINDKRIVLIHAMNLNNINDICDLKINDNNLDVITALWGDRHPDVKKRSIGNNSYFTIKGHTPVDNIYGYNYDNMENVLNIDGGCAFYSYVEMHNLLLENGYMENDYMMLDKKRYKYFSSFNHYPLVEILDNKLRLLTFNNDNQIVSGNYFDGSFNMICDEELDIYRMRLKDSEKVKKLIKM